MADPITALAVVPKSVASLARSVNIEPTELVEVLKKQIMPNATLPELAAFCMIAAKYGLDPFTKQIYAIRKNGSGAYEPYISADGWYAIAERHPQFRHVEFVDVIDDAGQLVAITCRMWRKDRERPIEVTEYLAQCRRETPAWRSNPNRLLRHRAFRECTRVTLGISGVGVDPDDVGIAKQSGADAINEALCALPGDGELPVCPAESPAVIDAEIVSDDPPIACDDEARNREMAESLVAANADAGVQTTAERIMERAAAAVARGEAKTLGDWLASRIEKAVLAFGESSNQKGTAADASSN